MKPLRTLACILALLASSLALVEVPAQAASASIGLSPTKGRPEPPSPSPAPVSPRRAPEDSAGVNSAAFTVAASGYFTADVVIPPTSQQVLDIQAVSGTVKASAAFTVAAATPVTSPPAISSAPLRLGVGTPGGPLASAELDQAASLAGEAPPVILSYEDFNQAPPELRRLAPGKQVLVAETSSAEQGGSKADWNTALISYLASQTDVTTVVWFDFNKETDWRIDSSTTSATALEFALAARPK